MNPSPSTPRSNPLPHIHLPSAPHKYTLILLHGTSTTGPSFAAEVLSYPILTPTSPSPETISVTLTKPVSTFPNLYPHTRFVFPTGSPKPLTVLSLPSSNPWFDIHSFADRTLGEEIQAPHLRESILYLQSLIDEEVNLLNGDASRLVILGFSQGAALGSVLLLSGVLSDLGRHTGSGIEGVEKNGTGNRIGGYVGMSGWLPFRKQLHDAIDSSSSSIIERRLSVRKTLRSILSLPSLDSNLVGTAAEEDAMVMSDIINVPILYLHGTSDTKVRVEWCREMIHLLAGVEFPARDQEARSESAPGLNLNIQLKEYEELGHHFCDEEMLDLVGFLNSVWRERDGS